MVNKILCAVDATGEADVILEKASALADKFGAKLSIITVIEYAILPKDYQQELENTVIPKFDAFGEKYGIPKKRRHVKFGQSYGQICGLAKEKDMDLIIIGSHAKKGLQLLMGSTANGVMQQAPCDVFLIKMNNTKS